MPPTGRRLCRKVVYWFKLNICFTRVDYMNFTIFSDFSKLTFCSSLVSPYFTLDAPFTLNICELGPFSLVIWIFLFFLDAPFFQFTVTQVFLISTMSLLGEVMKRNPNIPVVPKKTKLKKSWVALPYLSRVVYALYRRKRNCHTFHWVKINSKFLKKAC